MTNEEAIKRLEEGAPFSAIYNAEWEQALQMGIDALKKQKQGYWIDNGFNDLINESMYECSCCHNVSIWFYHFCPNCGAEMGDDGVRESEDADDINNLIGEGFGI